MAETSDAKIRQIRQQIADLDSRWIQLLEARAEAVRELRNLGVRVDARSDEASRETMVAAASGSLSAKSLRAVLRELQSACRSAVDGPQVAFLGPLFSYSHIATLERFGAAANMNPVANIAAVFAEVRSGRAEYGVVPIENSTDGRIVDTLSMLARQPLPITGEIQLRIHHCLLSRCELSEVTVVCSKPQALSQCREWLGANRPQAELREVASTALAAEMAASQPGVAAIASQQAGVQNDLDVIAANIEDNPENVTRFAIVGGLPAEPSGRDKTTLMFQLPHQPGALADAMMVFKKQALNLTWIESFPMPGAPNEYVFFVEFEGHAMDAACRDAVETLRESCLRLDVLGSYPRCAPVG